MVGWGVNIFGRTSAGNQPVAGDRARRCSPGTFASRLFSQRSKSTVPGNGVSITNCAKVKFSLLRQSSGRRRRYPGDRMGKSEDEGAQHVHAVLLERAGAASTKSRRPS